MSDVTLIPQNIDTMTSIQFAEMTGREVKSINRTIREQFSNEIAGALIAPAYRVNGQVGFYNLPELEAIMLCAILDKMYLRKIASFWKDNRDRRAKVLPQNFADACRQLADKHEQLQFAIDTKAEIGSRREATAMNTASQAVKSSNKLQIELDKSKEYASVKKMEGLTGEKFGWSLLKKTALAMGSEIPKIPDPNFPKGVNSYHKDVWLEAYGLDISEEV